MNAEKQVDKLVVRLHFEGGIPKLEIASALMRAAMEAMDFPKGGHMLVRRTEDDRAIMVPDSDMRDALDRAADQFMLYERHHLAKDTEEAREKAIVNREMGVMCYRAIGKDVPPMPEGQPEYVGTSYDHTPAPEIADADVILYIQGKARTAGKRGLTDTARVLDNLADDLAQGLHVGLEDPHKALVEITAMIGDANVKAGWWTDANQDLRIAAYAAHVFAGKLALVHSEVSEALEGHRKSKKGAVLMDDHLPEYPMVAVEIADAHIRLFDFGANYRTPDGDPIDVPSALIAKLAYNAQRLDHKPEHRAAAGGKTI